MISIRNLLLSSVALSGCLVATSAGAQVSQGVDIGEVVVTATRTSDTVSRVPLTVQAVTQANLDEQGIKNASDLVRFVPGLNVAATAGTSLATFSIRGVVGGTGAATTSVYLDDTNLTKRANGGVSQQNGAPVPLLYDLERVEVLKGPQGTLFGGSSEGGTVRYITPTPSLTNYSAQARGESSWFTGHGEQSWELSGAAGGPLIKDRLGVRLSLIKRTQGGNIDVLSPYTGKTIRENANSTTEWAGRIAFLGKINENLSATVSYYRTAFKSEGGPGGPTVLFMPDGSRAPANQTFTTPDMCISGYRTAATPFAQPGGPAGTAFIPPNAVCTAANRATALYVRPGATYGPFATGDNIAYTSAGPFGGSGRQLVAGGNNNSDIASFTLNFDYEGFNVKSVSSYLHDQASTNTTGGEDYVSVAGANQTTTMAYPGCSANPCRGFGLFAQFPDSSAQFLSTNRRTGLEQELRISAPVNRFHFSWVAGVFYSNANTHIVYNLLGDPSYQDALQRALYGPRANGTDRYGVANTNGVQTTLDAAIRDRELAAFAEINVFVTSKLKLIGGLRKSRVELNFRQLNYGQTSARLASSQGSLVVNNGVNKPMTPKFGAQYQFTETNMAYATAAKGFRAGGGNTALSQNNCGQYLALYGLTADTVPATYAPDSVWSYEAGAKFRAFNKKLSVNAAVYRVDWKDIQSTITLTCGQSFVTGGGRARSEGVDLQAQFRPITPLTLTLNFGYTDAHYVDPVGGINGVLPPGSKASINAGDPIAGVAPIQLSFSGQYNATLFEKYESYIRFDYTYTNKYASGPSFGSTGYNALTRVTRPRDQLNLRIGTRIGPVDANVFAFNLLDAHKPIGSGLSNGRTCSNTSVDCSAYTGFDPFVNQTYQAPRRIGVQVNYRY